MHLAHTFALSALFAVSVIAPAHAQTPQAFYPLISDLLDATATYGPITLGGNPPPAPPSNGVCVNGIYLFNPSGQDVRTPVIVSFDQNDFQLDFEFSLAALPPSGQRPVLMGGNGWRFIGLYVQANGTVGLKYNNSNFTWSTTQVAAGPWYLASIRYEQGNVEVHLNGVVVHQATLGALNTNNNFNFTTNDFSNGYSHNGCIRNLLISNDTTLGATATPYGTGCDGLGLGASGVPSVGNSAFGLVLTNVPTVSPIAFVGFGSAAVNPGVDLGVIGMAGCFAYTSLDLGLFGPVGAPGGTASFPLPIPPNPSLVAAQLAAQGASLSAATTLGLASSNGLLLTIAL